MGSSPSFLDPFIIPLVKGPRILDVGCGFGRWGYLCTANYWETAEYEPGGGKPIIIGCDGYEPNVEMSKRSGAYADVLLVKFPPLQLGNRSFDTVLLLEVLEHLSGEEGMRLIQESKRIARRRVILSTPSRPDYRPAKRTITGWNPLEAHRSFLDRKSLLTQGFRVYTVGWDVHHRAHAILQRCFGRFSWFEERVKPGLHGVRLPFACRGSHSIGIWERETGGKVSSIDDE